MSLMSIILPGDAGFSNTAAPVEQKDDGSTQADFKADLSAKAAAMIENAGNGLVAAHTSCLSNTADAKTLYTLMVVQDFISDALKLLTEKDNSNILSA